MSQPIVKRDDYWADFWNSLFMRPVYRKPFPTTDSASNEAPAQNSSSGTKAHASNAEKEASAKSHGTPKHAATAQDPAPAGRQEREQAGIEGSDSEEQDFILNDLPPEASRRHSADQSLAVLFTQLDHYLAGKNEQEVESLAKSLELSLPDIDGFEVAARLRQFSDAYVHMLIASTEELLTEERPSRYTKAQSSQNASPADTASTATSVNGGLRDESTADASNALSELGFKPVNENVPNSQPSDMDVAQQYAGYTDARAAGALDPWGTPILGISTPTEREVLEQLLGDIRSTFHRTDPGSLQRSTMLNVLIREVNNFKLHAKQSGQQEGQQRVSAPTRREQDPGQ